jgi:hypothetical protein
MRLRDALDNEPVPRDLEAKVRARLDAGASWSPWPRLIPGLAMLVFLAGFVGFYDVTQTRRLLRIGIADHLHCAIEGEYPKQTDRAAMTGALGPYSLMLRPILDQAPGDAVVSAHRCTIGGRAYVHVILRRDGKMLSVILTKRAEGESFPRMMARAASIRDGELDGYAVSGFNAGGSLGYVVSSMPLQQNQELAVKLAPVIRRYTGA